MAWVPPWVPAPVRRRWWGEHVFGVTVAALADITVELMFDPMLDIERAFGNHPNRRSTSLASVLRAGRCHTPAGD
jgi:hypothetical protein